MTELLGAAEVMVDTRPASVAWLVPRGVRRSVRGAIEAASGWWGSLSQLIVPVSRAGRVPAGPQQLLDILRPDIYAGIDLDDRRLAGLRRNGIEPLSPARFDHELFGSHQLGVVAPETLPDLSLAFGRASLRGVAALGWLDEDDEAFMKSLGVRAYPAEEPAGALRAQFDEWTLLHLGASLLGEVEATNLAATPIVIWVCGPNAYDDVLQFWNLRALAPRSIAHAPMALVAPDVGLHDHASAIIREVVARVPRSEPNVIINSLSLDPQELRVIAQRLGLVESQARQLKVNVVDGSPIPSDEPIYFRINVSLLPHVLGRRVRAVRPGCIPPAIVRRPGSRFETRCR